ncbi:MAG TPA: mechanosensitive ion channel domain-containing protein [Phycisphaerae bacterium]|nr:mechanosensitive ion channel domain-containing protein [Phycisphaerae bacterium]
MPPIGIGPARLFLLLVLATNSAALAQSSTTHVADPATTQPATSKAPSDDEKPLELRFTTVPRIPADIGKCLQQIEEEVAALAPTTQPATTQPTTQPDAEPSAQLDAWRIEQWNALQEFKGQLEELRTQILAVEQLSQDGEIAKLTEYITELKRKTAAVEGLAVPDDILEEEIAEARSLYETNNQALDALLATLSQQEALLREGFTAQRGRLAAELKSAQAHRQKLEAGAEVEAKAAENEVSRSMVAARLRASAAREAALETARVVVELREKRTQQELEQSKLRLDALRPYVVALRKRMNELIEARSAASVTRLRERIQDPDLSPLMKAFYQLQLLRDENIATLQADFANAIRDRFPASALTTLGSMVKRDKRYWADLSHSLSRRSSAEVLTAYREAGQELVDARRVRERLLRLLDQSFIEERKIELLSLKALDEFKSIESKFREVAGQADDEQTIKRKQQVGQFRLELRNAFDEMLKLEQEVIERVRKGVDFAQANVALWEEAESRLYWARLITRGPTILEPEEYHAISAEVEMLYAGGLAKALNEARQAARRRWQVVTWVDGVILSIALAGALFLGYRVLRKSRRIYREGLEDGDEKSSDEELAPPRFGRRLRFHAARVAFTVVPIVLVAAYLEVLIQIAEISGPPARLFRTVGILVSGSVLAFAVLNAAFKAPKPRYRLITCSTTVARYYRRFGYTLVVLAMLLIGSAILLQSLDVAPATAEQLTGWFVFATTAVMLVFMVRRNTVLNVFPRNVRGQLAGLVTFFRAVHPFGIALFVLLLIMNLIGYRALAAYIVVGLGATLAYVLSGMLAYQLSKELIRWCTARIRHLHKIYAPDESEAKKPTGESAAPDAGTAAPTKPTGAPEEPPLARAVVTAVRWALVLLVLMASLSIWGIRPYEIKLILDYTLWHRGDHSITLWRIAGSVLAILVAVMISRTARQTLNARFYPHHKSIDRGAQAAIDTLLHYLIIAIGVYIALQTLRLDFGAMAVLFGGLGLGIGLGFQPLVVNFVSGLFMLFERHVKVGDVVIVHDKMGEVTRVSMRSTTIRTPDGVYLVIPNGEFINQKVENWTLEGKPIRGLVDVGVSYGADPKRVKELLLEIAFAEPKVLMDPPPDVFFTQFGDSSLNFSLACWFNNPAERWFGMLSMRYAIMEKFRENNIDIPIPQRAFNFASDRPIQVQLFDGSVPQPPRATAKVNV